MGREKKKTRSLCLTLFSPTHRWAITVHATRRLPDSVTAQSVFRCMNKTFRHLFLEVAPRKQDKTRQRGIPSSPGPSTHSVKPQLFTAYFSSRPTPNGGSTCILVTKGLWLNPISPFCPSHFDLPLRFAGSRLRCRASRFLSALSVSATSHLKQTFPKGTLQTKSSEIFPRMPPKSTATATACNYSSVKTDF